MYKEIGLNYNTYKEGMNMEPTFKVRCNKKYELEGYLNKKGVTLKDEAEYVVIDNDRNLKNQLLAIKNSSYEIVNYSDILYFESQLNDVFCVLKNDRLTVQYKLYELEEILENNFFMRVHKSFLVNLKKINRIIPESNSRFILVMNNKDQISVSRTYIKGFKDYFRL